jgi:protein TonB
LRREEEGTVGVAVTIGANGRVTGCSVTRSSGSERLDSAACQGMQRYARFNPAKDRNGNPTNGSFATSITYRLN